MACHSQAQIPLQGLPPDQTTKLLDLLLNLILQQFDPPLRMLVSFWSSIDTITLSDSQVDEAQGQMISGKVDDDTIPATDKE